MPMRRTFLKIVSSLAASAALPAAWAQSFPSRPIKLVVGYPAGSGVDFIARAVQPKMMEVLGQPVVIDNKPGGSGVLAASFVANSPPDGYTLVFTVPGSTSTARAALGNKLQYAPEELVPVGMIGETPLVLLAPGNSAVRTLAQLVELARKTPGGLNVASYGIGSPSHFGIEMLKAATGVPLTHVPFQGSPAAVTALLGGQVHAFLDSVTSGLVHIASGRATPLAVTSTARLSKLPQVPTFAEEGMPSVLVSGWAGLHAARGTPPAIVQQLNAALNAALATPDVRAKLADRLIIVGGPPSVLAAHVRDETVRLEKVIKDSGIQLN
jgi:tripartite-type tricarboxylate transporter receptor subunit TctC